MTVPCGKADEAPLVGLAKEGIELDKMEVLYHDTVGLGKQRVAVNHEGTAVGAQRENVIGALIEQQRHEYDRE